MNIRNLFQTARSVTIEIEDGGFYQSVRDCEIYVNGVFYQRTGRTVKGIYGLLPDTEYEILAREGDEEERIFVHTDTENFTLNVRDFGAKGNGIQDDTPFIQATIMACPRNGRVLIPEGTYRITSLFLKDDLKLELAKGAVLSADTDRTRFPILPGMIEGWDEKSEYNLGTWEGNPLDMFAGIITGIQVKNVVIYGQGMIEGNASADPLNWWYNEKVKLIAWRPRMIFLNRCENIVVEGIRVQNSPSWNIHPYFSKHLRFFNLTILNPKISPNTDGLNPESCKDVKIIGCCFSLGDDCIAIKAGKIYMGSKYRVPCDDIVIRQCFMGDGHSAVTLGSEMAGGVRNLTVSECQFVRTDRGLQIKTRRGRGRDAIIDGIHFENIYMERVLTPFVINSFYYCDPDGHTDYVRTKEALPVDERTPEIRRLNFRHILCDDCEVAGAFFTGLPEKKIREIHMEHIHIKFAKDAKPNIPAMMDDLEPCCRLGIYALNVAKLQLEDVTIEGQEGEPFILNNIDTLIR